MTKTKKNSSTKVKKKKSLGFKIFIGFLCILLAILTVGGGYVIGLINKMDNVELNKDNLGIVEEDLKDYDNVNKIKNIALFGLDSTDGETGRSDAIMIATVDPIHNKVKLTSIMRDSYVYIDGYGNDKINHAYAYGGPELSIKTINENFGLNIEDFVSVNFSSLPVIINILGGVDIEITEEELQYINDYINDINNRDGTASPNITYAGVQHLDGTQALAYSRIRYTSGGDYKRTERQRTVLEALFNKLTSASVSSYNSLLNKVLPYVQTNLNTGDILSLGTNVLGIGNNLEQDRFPRDGYCEGAMIDGVYYLTFDIETAKQQMRDYIFNDIK
ncbi:MULTISPECIES: LCP family protein [unclassified Clostridium]|uniref:LCP family protein n=1 Tax=unclassified Clostridium TaxID=2614128 RepID=UPI0025BBA10A|nr:LCP family protein [Clostridium sp.]MCI6690959.1 LCP family protein [Clostridium sp.]MDY2632610.1 LCP family protein [Clostridium sp.]MDY4252153.1 LCP family protein [Clostridium sp.]MDY6226482.1 LCP family protein [Clostridium sp.]